MKKIILSIVLLLAAVSYAQVDTVILVSDITSADMLIAKSAGEKAGMPVLVLANGELDDDVRAELVSLNVKTVILVGGPSVIKESTQTELSSKYDVVRLWGHERTGTSLEVAKYFWSDGANCVVVADDTKNSEDDTAVQAEASESASAGGCPFIPVPEGTVPAEVLETVNSLGISEARFMGLKSSAEFRAKFVKLKIKETIGDRNEIEREVEIEVEDNSNETVKLVIVAAPNWKDVLGHSGHSGRHTIVRIVSSSDVTQLVDLIKTKSITDVRVVGKPALADEIASKLAEAGINATKISGEKSSDVSRKSLDDSVGEWENRSKLVVSFDPATRARLKPYLIERLSKLESRLNHLESELASKRAEGVPENEAAAMTSRIDAAKRQLDAIRTYIDNSNFETANLRIAKVSDDVERARWRGRDSLGVNVEVELRKEESSIEDLSKEDTAEVEAKLAMLRAKCNDISSIESLVDKEKSLRQSANSAASTGDFEKNAEVALEMRDVIERARHLSTVCERLSKIDDKYETSTSKLIKRAEDVRVRSSNSGSSEDD